MRERLILFRLLERIVVLVVVVEIVFVVVLDVVGRVNAKGAYKIANKNKDKDKDTDLKWNRDRFNFMGGHGYFMMGGDRFIPGSWSRAIPKRNSSLYS